MLKPLQCEPAELSVLFPLRRSLHSYTQKYTSTWLKKHLRFRSFFQPTCVWLHLVWKTWLITAALFFSSSTTALLFYFYLVLSALRLCSLMFFPPLQATSSHFNIGRPVYRKESGVQFWILEIKCHIFQSDPLTFSLRHFQWEKGTQLKISWPSRSFFPTPLVSHYLVSSPFSLFILNPHIFIWSRGEISTCLL